MILMMLMALAGEPAESPMVAAGRYCLGEGALPTGFVRDARSGAQIWSAGDERMMISRIDELCLFVDAKGRGPAVEAWLAGLPGLRLDHEENQGGLRIRDYSRSSLGGRQKFRVLEPGRSEYDFGFKTTSLSIWTEPERTETATKP